MITKTPDKYKALRFNDLKKYYKEIQKTCNNDESAIIDANLNGKILNLKLYDGSFISLFIDNLLDTKDNNFVCCINYENKAETRTMSCEEYYQLNKGKKVTYKDQMLGYVAGFLEHYIIIGFIDDRGCIKSFSDRITYDTTYPSYRLSKLKHLKIID